MEPVLPAGRGRPPDPAALTPTPTLGDLAATFARIGVLSFGGAAGQIALMHRVLVDEKRWLDDARYLNATRFCMLLPGPEAQQLATYAGWTLHGVRGGLVAGLLFVLPGAALMLGLSFLYLAGTGTTLVDGVFHGIKAAVLALIVHALIKIAGRALSGARAYGLAVAAFAAILLFDIAFPLIILGAGLIGLLGAASRTADPGAMDPAPSGATRGALVAALCCLAVWWAPVALAALVLGSGHMLVEIGLFFSKLAVVTFGGAYAVLAWLTQEAVAMGWVDTTEMIDGLGLAETTPGPTILVNQFIAFLAALRAPGDMAPMMAAVLAAAMATWTTFAPSFLWIFAGAPFMERLARNPRLAGALEGITAAVVGVIGFIAFWFALHVIFGTVVATSFGPVRLPLPDPASLDVGALGLTMLAFVLVFRLHLGIPATVAILGALGVALNLLGL